MCNVKYSVIRLVSAFPVCTYSNSHDVDPTVKWQPHQVTVYLWREHVAPGNPHLERISFHLVHKKLFHATICSTTTCKNNCLTNKFVWLFHQVEKLFYYSSKKMLPCFCVCCRVSTCTILGKMWRSKGSLCRFKIEATRTGEFLRVHKCLYPKGARAHASSLTWPDH